MSLTYEVVFGPGSLGLALSEDLAVVQIDAGGAADESRAVRVGDRLYQVAGAPVSTLGEAAPHIDAMFEGARSRAIGVLNKRRPFRA